MKISLTGARSGLERNCFFEYVSQGVNTHFEYVSQRGTTQQWRSASQTLEVSGKEQPFSRLCSHIPQREQQPPRERASVAIQTASFPHMLFSIEESELLPFFLYKSVFSFRQLRKGISLFHFTGSLKSGQQH